MPTRRVSLGFTGTSLGCAPAQLDALRTLVGSLAPTEAHHGDCVGADTQFHAVCLALGVPVTLHPPVNAWLRAFCGGAAAVEAEKPYLARNWDIVYAADVLVACSKELAGESLRSGTWATVRYARRHGIPVCIVRPDGSVTREPGRK